MLSIGIEQIKSMEKFSKEKYSLAFLIAALFIRVILKPEYFPTQKNIHWILRVWKGKSIS
jgi:hypothetical protein